MFHSIWKYLQYFKMTACNAVLKSELQSETSFKLCSNIISGATAELVYARNGPLQQVCSETNHTAWRLLNCNHQLIKHTAYTHLFLRQQITILRHDILYGLTCSCTIIVSCNICEADSTRSGKMVSWSKCAQWLTCAAFDVRFFVICRFTPIVLWSAGC